jgi:stress-induced morphogen
MLTLIKSKIIEKIPNATVYVADPHNDGEHFESVVISENFVGLSLVKQHQLVMNALKTEFKEKVHALKLKTFTPEQWEKQKNKYNV